MADTFHKPKIKALVVDDSPFMGMQIAEILNEDDQVEVVGRASGGAEALQMAHELTPDVITMDVEMPNMDGIATLKHIMVRNPIPTVMISSFTRETAESTFDALWLGAVDVITRPSSRETESLQAQRERIISTVKRAALMPVSRFRERRIPETASQLSRFPGESPDDTTCFVYVAAVNSGYYCLLGIIPSLPESFEHVLIATIPASTRHVAAFADYLERHSAVPVKNLRTAERFEKGVCYLCSEYDKLVLKAGGNGSLHFEFQYPGYHSKVDRPVDQILASLAHALGPRAAGVVIGARGGVGSVGIEEIRRFGGVGIVTNTAGCRQLEALKKLTAPKVRSNSTTDANHAAGARSASDPHGGSTVPENTAIEPRTDKERFSGFVAGIDIVEYLQFVLLTERPTVLEVVSERGETGRIYIRNGNVLHAHCGDLLGDQALYKCLAFRGGSFYNRPWREPAKVSVNKSGELVLTEAARRRDKAHREWTQVANS